MRRLSRRQFAGSVGAGLLLAPFINIATGRKAQAATKQVKRMLDLLLDGDEAVALDADGLRREHHQLERDDQPAGGGEGERRAGRGDAERQPEQRPRRLRQPDRPGLRLLRPGQSSRSPSISSSPRSCAATAINRPIASLLLGANTSDNGGISQFYGGAQRRQPADHRLAAVGVQHRVRRHAAHGDDGLVAARPPPEHPRRHQGGGDDAQGLAGQQREGEDGLPTSNPSGSWKTS